MGRKILFITTDQQRYDSLGCNGGTIARTPVVDGLAAEGINYRRAYNQNTVCMPARSTMLTGQYVRTHGVVANGIPLPGRRAVASPRTCTTRPATAPRCSARPTSSPASTRRTSGEENARVATRRHRSVARLRARRAGDARGRRGATVRSQHYGRWLDREPPRAPARASPACSQAEPGGDTGAPETKNNPIPREWYHTDWVADRTIAYLDSLAADEPTGSCGCRSPTRTTRGTRRRRSCTGCNWRDLDLPPGHPGSRRGDPRACSRRSRAHWLGYWEGTFVNMRGRPGHVPSRRR